MYLNHTTNESLHWHPVASCFTSAVSHNGGFFCLSLLPCRHTTSGNCEVESNCGCWLQKRKHFDFLPKPWKKVVQYCLLLWKFSFWTLLAFIRDALTSLLSLIGSICHSEMLGFHITFLKCSKTVISYGKVTNPNFPRDLFQREYREIKCLH